MTSHNFRQLYDPHLHAAFLLLRICTVITKSSNPTPSKTMTLFMDDPLLCCRVSLIRSSRLFRIHPDQKRNSGSVHNPKSNFYDDFSNSTNPMPI